MCVVVLCSFGASRVLFGVCDGVYVGRGCWFVHERACVLFMCVVRPLLTRNALARRCDFPRVLERKFPCVLCLVQLCCVACVFVFACFVLTRNALARRCGFRRVLVRKFPCVLCLRQLCRVACVVWCVRWCVFRSWLLFCSRACVCVLCVFCTDTQRPRTSLWLSSRFSL